MTGVLQRAVASRFIIWLALAVGGCYFFYHAKHYINFGIDLVGGTYITLEVQTEKAIESELKDVAQRSRDLFSESDIKLSQDPHVGDRHVTYTFTSVDDAHKGTDALMTEFPSYAVEQRAENVTLSLSSTQVQEVARQAVESNVVALSNRIDQFGVGETLVARQGENRILVELPNVHDMRKAKSLIGRAALLEIKVVKDAASSREAMRTRYGGEIPEGMEMIPGKEGDSQVYLVSRFADLTGKQLKTARLGYGGMTGSDPVVNFEWKSAAGKQFYELARNHMGEQIAIIVDGAVVSAPAVSTDPQHIPGQQGSISGRFTVQTAQELAALLRSGAFAAPVTFAEERHIGPSLGQEAIYQGLTACAIGLALLFVFSIVMYKTAGFLAFVVLLYNLLFILVALWGLGATLTLPGIAGMILTVGMAIDASILIYERIKEELAHGSRFRRAVEAGFSGATAVILDANITHFLIAAVLYFLGSGPIKGFAVTMIVGIVATLVTGLWMLRSFFTFALDTVGVNKLRI